MAEKPTDIVESTAVTIYGRAYHLRGSEDSAYLQELARLVDSKMREVARATGTADTLKLAILASLNIADEYLRASGSAPSAASGEDGKRLERLVTLLDEVLAEQGTVSSC